MIYKNKAESEKNNLKPFKNLSKMVKSSEKKVIYQIIAKK